MKTVFYLLIMLAMGLVTGCTGAASANADPTKLSVEFVKAARYSYSLIDQAWMGRPVKRADISRSLAELESVSSTEREKQIHIALHTAALDVDDSRFQVSTKGAHTCLTAVDSALRFNPQLADIIPDTFAADYKNCLSR